MKYLFIITFLLNFNIPAQDIDNKLEQIKDEFKIVIPKVRELASRFVLIADSTMYEKEDICVECEDILSLTNEINKILANFPNTEKSKELSLQRGNLEALMVVTTHAHLNTKKSSCNINEKVTSEFLNFDINELNLIFTNKLSKQIKSIQVENSSTKTIWLRGKDKDQDKFVKVEINSDGTNQISFYRLRIPTLEKIRIHHKKDDLPELGKKIESKSLKEKTSGEIEALLSLSKEDIDIYSYRAKIGPSITYEFFIPNKITYIDLSGSLEVSDSITLKGNLESSTEKNEAEIQLGSKDSSSYSSININSEGDYNIKAQYSFDFLDDTSLSSSVAYISDGVIEYTAKANTNGSSILTATYKRTRDKTQIYSIGKEFNFDPLTTISIKYERNKEEGKKNIENNYWLTFSRKY